jgi:hypothetical protein
VAVALVVAVISASLYVPTLNPVAKLLLALPKLAKSPKSTGGDTVMA